MIYNTVTNYSLIQTFYADSSIVANSTQISLTSINLYFKSKPNSIKNASGKPSPGVTVAICEVNNDTPDLSKIYYSSFVRKPYEEIFSFSDASAATTFGFGKPLTLKSNNFYGIVIIFEDPGFEVWQNKQGDALVGTNTVSSGSNIVKDGKFYLFNNAGIFNAISDTDLKFVVNVAKFNSNTVNEQYVNKAYEFFTLSSQSGNFIGGEFVYKVSNNATGTISVVQGSPVIVGTGTNFNTLTIGQPIVIHGNATSSQVSSVNQIVNATYIVANNNLPYTNATATFASTCSGRVYYKDVTQAKLYLVDSSANTTVKFLANDGIIGADSNATANIVSIDDFSVDLIRIHGNTNLPSSTKITANITMATYTGNTYNFDSNNVIITPDINSTISTPISQFNTFIVSRSNEVNYPSLYTVIPSDPDNTTFIDKKSLLVNVTAFSTASNTSLYTSPAVDGAAFDLFVTRYNINSNTHYLNANSVSIDSEVDGNGLALSRHISTKLTFANNHFAEDLRLYMTAHRPLNTTIKVYARIYNSADPDAFDDKSWSPLVYLENGNTYSSSVDRNDFIEYTLGFPPYSNTAATLPGSFNTQLSNNVITASGVDPTSYLANNNVIKLSNPLIPSNYIIAVAASVNSTAITLGSAIANNGLVGSGFIVDRVKYKNSAFNNITNHNVVRYYNSTFAEFDTYDSVQLKFVFLSNNSYIVPRIDFYQNIGVSA